MRLAIIAPGLALRAGLNALLGYPAAPGGADQVIIEAATLDEFAAAGVEADVLLLDGRALDEDALRRLAGDEPRLGVLALSDRPEAVRLLQRLPLTGWGVLSPDATADELHAGLRAVAAGLAAGTPALLAAAAVRPATVLSNGEEPELTEAGETLTERESQVLQHLARGLANKQIALALGISEHTVKFHVSSIYAKLRAANRTEAVRAGVRRGLVTL